MRHRRANVHTDTQTTICVIYSFSLLYYDTRLFSMMPIYDRHTLCTGLWSVLSICCSIMMMCISVHINNVNFLSIYGVYRYIYFAPFNRTALHCPLCEIKYMILWWSCINVNINNVRDHCLCAVYCLLCVYGGLLNCRELHCAMYKNKYRAQLSTEANAVHNAILIMWILSVCMVCTVYIYCAPFNRTALHCPLCKIKYMILWWSCINVNINNVRVRCLCAVYCMLCVYGGLLNWRELRCVVYKNKYRAQLSTEANAVYNVH